MELMKPPPAGGKVKGDYEMIDYSRFVRTKDTVLP
jgi:hypothetical protein